MRSLRPPPATPAGDYTTALSLAPLADDAWVVLLNRASLRTATGDGAAALADLDAAVAARASVGGPAAAKGEGILWANRALALMALGRYDAALADFSRAVEARPNEVAPWWLAYGQVLFECSRPGDGVGILRRVEGRFQGEDDPHALLAAVQFARGQVADAETEWSLVSRPRQWESRAYLTERGWTPRCMDAMDRFRTLKE
ncbi:hypothetical protein I4F81_011595 [Pyropia yezoensis]|uniref:Uncharacterized protein n=1 Tax=Pyropia yezoensis TaxID=2788 RepID=A0ACC3CGX0_PYRYE|nr:hypothetical protein I4F81_011595 [Neopyropia yezoensis]